MIISRRKGGYMNNVILVGRLTDNPKCVSLENGKSVTSVCLAVNRNFKNSDGIYETDFIKCILWNNIASCTCEYCHVGDVVGIKGRLQSSKYTDDNNIVHYITEVVADKVTFLSSQKKNSEDKNENDN